MEAVFEQSWRLLGERERAGLARLALGRGPVAPLAGRTVAPLALLIDAAMRLGGKDGDSAGRLLESAPGKLADIVLVDGDPTRDIADLRRVAAVLTQGALLSPNALYEALGIRPFVEQPPVLRPLAVAAGLPAPTPLHGAGHAH